VVLIKELKVAPGNPGVGSTGSVTVAGLWVNKRDHDVPCSFSNRQTLVVVRQSPRVHQHPSEPCVCDTAVVTDEPAPTSLQSKVTHMFNPIQPSALCVLPTMYHQLVFLCMSPNYCGSSVIQPLIRATIYIKSNMQDERSMT